MDPLFALENDGWSLFWGLCGLITTVTTAIYLQLRSFANFLKPHLTRLLSQDIPLLVSAHVNFVNETAERGKFQTELLQTQNEYLKQLTTAAAENEQRVEGIEQSQQFVEELLVVAVDAVKKTAMESLDPTNTIRGPVLQRLTEAEELIVRHRRDAPERLPRRKGAPL